MAERRISWKTDVVCDKNLRTECSGELKILLIINEASDNICKKPENLRAFITCPSCGMMASGRFIQDHFNIDAPIAPYVLPESLAVTDGACKELDVGEVAPKPVLIKSIHPTEFFGKNRTIWRGPVNSNGLSGEEDVDLRSLALTTFDPARLLLETCLKEKEILVTGKEKLERLKKKTNLIRLGGNVFSALWEDYRTNKENSILEWLYRNKKITYLDFFGLILRHSHGDRSVLCFSRDINGQWDWGDRWLDNGWSGRGFSAALASLPAEVVPAEALTQVD